MIVGLGTSLGLESHHEMCLAGRDDYSKPRCEGRMRGERVTCRGEIQFVRDKQYTKAKSLYICNWTENAFSPYVFFQKFHKVSRLTVKGGNLSFLMEDFLDSPIEHLTISGQPLDFLQPKAFSQLGNLKVLDLRHNQFHDLDPAIIYTLPESAKIYLSGMNISSSCQNIFYVESSLLSREIIHNK